MRRVFSLEGWVLRRNEAKVVSALDSAVELVAAPNMVGRDHAIVSPYFVLLYNIDNRPDQVGVRRLERKPEYQ